MTVPFVAQFVAQSVAGTAIGTFTSSLLVGVSSAAAADEYANVLSRQQSALYRLPETPPTASAVLDLYNKDFIGPRLCRTLLRNIGVNWGAVNADDRQRNQSAAWQAIGDAMRERPSVQFIMSLWSRGYWDADSDEAKAQLKRAGGAPEVWERYVTSMYDIPPVGTLMQANLRGYISNDEFDEDMKKLGIGHTRHRDMYKLMRDVNPPAVDWIHFAVKEALSPDVANRIQLYDEFPTEIGRYLNWHGLNWEIGMPITADGVNRQATIADLYWASHWTPIAPSQAYEMFHRLRRNRLQRYRDRGIPVTEFTLDDVERWLRINDYPKGVRDNLLALSFTPLRLVDIRQSIAFNWRVNNDDAFRSALPQPLQQRFDSYDRAWAVDQFMDRGVLPQDANTQVDIAIAQEIWRQQAPVRSAARSAVKSHINANLSAYRVGIISAEELRAGLAQDGVPQGIARSMETLVNAKVAEDTAKALIATLKKAYHKGLFSEDDARQALLNGGLRPEIVDANIERWNRDQTYDRVQANTSKILQWVSQGLMSPDLARIRLGNLGWSDPDTTLLMAEAAGRNQQLRAKAQKAADADRLKRSKELAKQLDAAKRNVAAIETAIRRQTPVSSLQRMLRKKIIGENVFLARMIRQGYPEDVAKAYLADALVKDLPTVQKENPGSKQQDIQSPDQQKTLPTPPEPATQGNTHASPEPSTSGTAVTRPETQVERPATDVRNT